MHAPMRIGWLLLTLLGALSPFCLQARPPAAGHGAAAEDFLIVDCLLPGQIRQLGTRTVYLSARRPTRTSAADCAKRGGEFVRQDRAAADSALSVWLPAAQRGDSRAQLQVGTILEQTADHDPADAADWYERAARQGNTEAQLKLAHLYEVGLGVPRNSERSLAWFRAAMDAGSGELDFLPPAANPTADAALQAMAGELEAARAENERLAEDLADAERSAQAALQAQLVQRTETLRALDERYRSMRAQYQAAIGERDAALLAAAPVNEAQPAGPPTPAQSRRIENLESRLVELQAHLDAALAQTRATEAAASQRLLAGPSLTIIEPRLPSTRGLVQVTAPQSGRQRVVGRVEAPAGLLTLSVNDQPQQPNPSGVFLAEIPLTTTTPVRVTAIDQQGKRQDVRFDVVTPTAPLRAAPDTDPGPAYQGIEFGSYHALVIGNDAYVNLPSLSTAVRDAEVVGSILRERYGFRTQVLLNADRYSILSALNGLRERLSSNDNLLIYYAGHGELDAVNMRGHWLPVDAEAASTANWISNVSITDVLNVMQARHIMLVVDSCYSGSMTRASTANLATAMTDAEQRNWLQTMVRKRGRLVLSSGGLAPVLDAGGGEHSVFARALIDVLRNNDTLLDGRGLYDQVAARVAYAASNVDFEQIPEFGPIRHAGHEAGAFFLVPGSTQGVL